MDVSTLNRKFTALGYDPPNDYNSSFNDLVLKLEEDFIKKYPPNKREKFKSLKGADWNKSLKNYLNDLNLHVPDDFFKGNQLNDSSKLNVLNKLLNLSLAHKYKVLSEENKLNDSDTSLSNESKSNQPMSNDTYKFVMDKLNPLLQKLNLPLLDGNSKTSEVKSAVELYLKLYSSDKSDTHNHLDENIPNLNEAIKNLNYNTTYDNEFTKLLRSMYTEELCKLQSETLWFTKELSKLPKT